MNEFFIQLGITLGLALAVSLVMKILKQPLLIGYIITGVIVGPAILGIISGDAWLAAFSHIGVALLLFIVGLGLRPQLIKEIGRPALIIAVAQIVFTFFVIYLFARLFSLNGLISLYLAFAFSLSSTIIVLRLLHTKHEQDTLYGRIVTGILLVQDVAAMIFFVVLSISKEIGSGQFLETVWLLVGKMAITAIGVYLLLKFIMPHIDKVFARDKETLFVFGIGTCFVLASVFYKLNFPLELGALAAGIILSVSPYQREIATRIQPLRDFFIIIFFVTLGANVSWLAIGGQAWMIIVFSALVLLLKPLILMLIMRLLKFDLRSCFFSGIASAQISEFSIIIVGMGISAGHLPKEILGVVTVVGIATIVVSSYLIIYNQWLFNILRGPILKFFPRAFSGHHSQRVLEEYDVVLFGVHRLGGGLLEELQESNIKFLAVDCDPEIIRDLQASGVNALFGSADDLEFLDSLPLKTARIVISTIPDIETNLILLESIRRKNLCSLFVANYTSEAESLYNAGATYVIMPPYLGRRYFVDLLHKFKFNRRKYAEERVRHLVDLPFLGNGQG